MNMREQLSSKREMENSNAFLYGKGIFTTIAIRNGEPFLWEKHWRRLIDNAARIDLDISAFSESQIKTKLTEQLESDGISNGRARITFSDGRSSSIWPSDSDGEVDVSIITGPPREISSRFSLGISPYTINSHSPLAGVKSCNYLENILALDDAKSRGLDEVIRTNERGFITSGCMSNLFLVKKGMLYTPSLKTGCLPGTTREYVLEHLDCEEVESRIEELNGADAVYLTSAGIGIVRVSEFEGRELADTWHPISQLSF